MKTKKVVKSLSLNKETIAHLAGDAMNGAKGGGETLTWCVSLDLCSEHPTCWPTPGCTKFCTVDCTSIC